jgi:hypothetical protein
MTCNLLHPFSRKNFSAITKGVFMKVLLSAIFICTLSFTSAFAKTTLNNLKVSGDLTVLDSSLFPLAEGKVNLFSQVTTHLLGFKSSTYVFIIKNGDQEFRATLDKDNYVYVPTDWTYTGDDTWNATSTEKNLLFKFSIKKSAPTKTSYGVGRTPDAKRCVSSRRYVSRCEPSQSIFNQGGCDPDSSIYQTICDEYENVPGHEICEYREEGLTNFSIAAFNAKTKETVATISMPAQTYTQASEVSLQDCIDHPNK